MKKHYYIPQTSVMPTRAVQIICSVSPVLNNTNTSEDIWNSL